MPRPAPPADGALKGLSPVPQARSASARVAEQLRDLIASGNLAPGDRLPSENELARALQVSRPVVREALRGLAMLGLVETRQGGGATVTDLTAERLLEPLGFYLSLRDHSTAEVFRARALIDAGLAHDAALRASEAERAQLLDIARTGFDLVGDPTGFRVLDARFHALIMDAAGNAFLAAVSRALYSLDMELRRRASAMPGVLDRSARQHEEIARAIAEGDAPRAALAMTAHVEHVRATTLAAKAAGP